MIEVTQKSNAKINIGLNVLNKRDDGYHNLKMIMVPIDLADTLDIKFFSEPGKLEISCNKKEIPTDRDNIIYKVYDAFYEAIGKSKEKIEVKLTKKIPSEAGLGGGSSNGSFFIKALNRYHKNILTESEMIKIVKNIGADLPFFVKNRSAIVEGIGEKIKPFENRLESDILLIKPNFGISAKEGYISYSKKGSYKKANILKIKDGLKTGNLELVKKNIENNLQEALLKTNKKLKDFQNKLEKINEYEFFMTGSGTTYYTFLDKEDVDTAYNYIKNKLKNIKIIKSKLKLVKGEVQD